MGKRKISLILEGGGMRGAYTAGALSWLIDNNLEFDSAYGISTGAIHLANFLMKNKDNLFSYSTNVITDKRIMGIPSILRCGLFVDYDFMFNELLEKQNGFDITPLKNIKTNAKLGLYELDIQKTIYHLLKDVSMEELKGACTLPLLGKYAHIGDRKFLDGGITDMIPIDPAIEDGNDLHIIITTKPGGYVRKPSNKFVVFLMKVFYSKWPQLYKDYAIRDKNYVKQINHINELVEDEKALYIYPSKKSNVSRLGGSKQELIELYELGWSDMEFNKEKILALFNR